MDKNQLQEILDKHKKWIEGKEGGVKADLRGADLQEANLQEADLYGANLRGANLRGANLHGANLRGADLQEANLQEADLYGANLRGANLYGANLRRANLQEANLDFSVLYFHCKTLDIKVCDRLPRQLAYHICRMGSDSEEVKEMQALLKPFANKFHRVEECGLIK